MNANTDRTKIRELGPGDWTIKRDLRIAALRDAPETFGGSLADTMKRTEAQWRDWPGGVVFGAYLDDKPKGMAAGWCHPDKPTGPVEVIAMWVDPAARGHRIAAHLLDAITSWARDNGHDEVVLEIMQHNASARRAYERFGFVAFDGPVSQSGNIAMRLKLS